MDNKTIINFLNRESLIKVNGKDFIPYAALVMGLNLSSHIRQLEKRKAAYPSHFVEVENKPYISVEYAICLERFHSASTDLKRLKEKEANHG